MSLLQIDYQTVIVVSAISGFIGVFVGELAKEVLKEIREYHERNKREDDCG